MMLVGLSGRRGVGKMSIAAAMQRLGNWEVWGFGDQSVEQTWGRLRESGWPKVVIPDVCTVEQAHLIRTYGLLVRVERPNNPLVYDRHDPWELGDWPDWNMTVINDGAVSDLDQDAREIMDYAQIRSVWPLPILQAMVNQAARSAPDGAEARVELAR